MNLLQNLYKERKERRKKKIYIYTKQNYCPVFALPAPLSHLVFLFSNLVEWRLWTNTIYLSGFLLNKFIFSLR